VAVLDVAVSGGSNNPVLEALHARHIPVVIYTGGSQPNDVRRRHPDLTVVTTPVQPTRLITESRRVSGKLV
jgi:hypothetical protein